MRLTRTTSSQLTSLLSILFVICLAATIPTGGQSSCTPFVTCARQGALTWE